MAAPAWAEEFACRVVQDDSGAPVASAGVIIKNSRTGKVAVEAMADDEGRFSTSLLGSGEYLITVQRPGYLEARIAARVGGAREPLIIRLVRLGAITGRVMDASGRPRRGARVLAMARAAGGGLRVAGGLGAVVPVDSLGNYRLYNLPPGEYAVAVSERSLGLLVYPNNAQPEFFTVTGGEDHRGVDFIVATGVLFNVRGKVEAPKPGLVFSVALASADQPAVATAVTMTSTEGSFRIDGVPPGSYHLFAVGPAMGRAAKGAMLASYPMFGRTRLDITSANVTDITVLVGSGASARVRLRAELGGAGACPQTSAVTVTSIEDWAAVLDRRVEAAFDKETEIPNLAPGKYQLTATELGTACYQTEDAVLDLTGGGAGKATITVAAAGSIRGVLTGGKDVECEVVLLAVKPSQGREAIQMALPDADGRFGFDGLAPGEYRIAVRRVSEGRQTRWVSDDAWLTQLRVPGGVPTEVELPVPVPPAKDRSAP